MERAQQDLFTARNDPWQWAGQDEPRQLELLLQPPRSHIDNFRRREWAPAIEASGVARPARINGLRSTFASNSIAAGVSVFELARVMGTSIEMVERHYGTLLDGASAGIARVVSWRLRPGKHVQPT